MVRRFGRSAPVLGALLLFAAACGDDADTAVNNEPGFEQDAAAGDDDPTDNDDAPDMSDSDSDLTDTDADTDTGDDAGSADDTDPVDGSGSIDEGLRPFINDSVDQLAATLSIPRSQITVQTARLVQWSDSSLGCPEKDMEYAQVANDGSVMELVVDGTSYWFHSGGNRTPFPCTSALRINA